MRHNPQRATEAQVLVVSKPLAASKRVATRSLATRSLFVFGVINGLSVTGLTATGLIVTGPSVWGAGPSAAIAQSTSGSAGGASAGEAGGTGSIPVDNADLPPHEGEIRVEGKLLAVDAAGGTLTLGVTAYALPSGGARRLNAPRAKSIVVSDLTLLHVRGNAARAVTLGQLKDEVFAVAIGPDMGSGQALSARRIAVWNRVQNGSYRFDGATGPSSPRQPSAGAAEEASGGTALSGAVPTTPEVARATAPYNELPDGGFESPAQGLPGEWTFGRSARWERDEKGNHFALLAVEAVGGEVPEAERKIKTYLDVNPAWKTVRVSARMRLRKSLPGKVQDAHLGVVYYGANSEFLGLGSMLTLTKDSEWDILSHTSEVPPGTRRLMIDVGLYGPAGELSIDDVRVEASPRLAAGPLRLDFAPGA